jgi:uncharacterized membrane protein
VISTAASLYEWLLFLHIVAAMVWVGGAVLVGALATRVARAGRAEDVARFLGDLRAIGPRVLAPSTVAVLGLGIWMVLKSSAWHFGQGWVRLALGLFAAAFLLGAAHQSRAAINAGRAAERGDEREALRQLVRWSAGYWAILLILLVAVWDMVFKPGL